MWGFFTTTFTSPMKTLPVTRIHGARVLLLKGSSAWLVADAIAANTSNMTFTPGGTISVTLLAKAPTSKVTFPGHWLERGILGRSHEWPAVELIPYPSVRRAGISVTKRFALVSSHRLLRFGSALCFVSRS